MDSVERSRNLFTKRKGRAENKTKYRSCLVLSAARGNACFINVCQNQVNLIIGKTLDTIDSFCETLFKCLN